MLPVGISLHLEGLLGIQGPDHWQQPALYSWRSYSEPWSALRGQFDRCFDPNSACSVVEQGAVVVVVVAY